MKESDEGRRVIKLNACERRGCIAVHIENYCAEKIRFKDGVPLTSKADKDNHGFGVKSMRYIVDKYGGNLAMRQEGCLVCLDFMLPLPAAESAGRNIA